MPKIEDLIPSPALMQQPTEATVHNGREQLRLPGLFQANYASPAFPRRPTKDTTRQPARRRPVLQRSF